MGSNACRTCQGQPWEYVPREPRSPSLQGGKAKPCVWEYLWEKWKRMKNRHVRIGLWSEDATGGMNWEVAGIWNRTRTRLRVKYVPKDVWWAGDVTSCLRENNWSRAVRSWKILIHWCRRWIGSALQSTVRVKSSRLLHGGRKLRRSEYYLERTVDKQKTISGRFIVKLNLNKKKLKIRD